MSRRRLHPLFAIACAIAMSACAHETPAAKTAPPTAAAKKADPAPDFPPPQAADGDDPKLGIDPIDGWTLAPPPKGAPPKVIGALLHSSDGKTMDAMIIFFREPSAGSLEDAIAPAAKEVTDSGGKIARLSATDTLIVDSWSGIKQIPGMQGKLAVWRSKKYPKLTFTLISYWKPADAAARGADFDTFAAGLRL